jgi:hypothetical protein
MVVVPTSHTVVLTYSSTKIDVASKFGSLLGLLGVLGLVWSDIKTRDRSDMSEDPGDLPEGGPDDGLGAEPAGPVGDDSDVVPIPLGGPK